MKSDIIIYGQKGNLTMNLQVFLIPLGLLFCWYGLLATNRATELLLAIALNAIGVGLLYRPLPSLRDCMRQGCFGGVVSFLYSVAFY